MVRFNSSVENQLVDIKHTIIVFTQHCAIHLIPNVVFRFIDIHSSFRFSSLSLIFWFPCIKFPAPECSIIFIFREMYWTLIFDRLDLFRSGKCNPALIIDIYSAGLHSVRPILCIRLQEWRESGLNFSHNSRHIFCLLLYLWATVILKCSNIIHQCKWLNGVLCHENAFIRLHFIRQGGPRPSIALHCRIVA